MKRGRLILISGPSGVGKGTIRERIDFNDFVYSISSTTRAPRIGEVDGEHYNFISQEEFEKKIANGDMLEYAEFVGNYYGTDQHQVNKLLDQGKNVLLEIECVGAMQVLKKVPDVISIFILPPSIEELVARLKKRATEDEETIKLRIKKAQEEMQYKDLYTYNVINDNLEHASQQLDQILKSECGYEK